MMVWYFHLFKNFGHHGYPGHYDLFCRNGNPLQYSCLENPMDGGTSQATVHGVTESDMTE